MNKFLSLIALIAVSMFAAPEASAQAVNTKPKPNIVGQNGAIAPSILSTDPQIAQCVFGDTGVTVTESTLTTFASATEFPCTVLRGAMVETDASGFLSERRNGLYKVSFAANCTGITSETGRVTAQISTDGGTNWTQITGADAQTVFLTGTLQHNLSGQGYVSVSQTSSALGAGNIVIALRGSSSGAGNMTCADGGGLFVERADQLQPATYP